MEKLENRNLYDINETIAKKLFENTTYPWECIPKIGDFILEIGKNLDKEKFEQKEGNIWIAKSAKVDETAFICGPAIIDEGVELRHGSFIRGNAIIGKNSVVGNSTEVKNAVIFNDVQIPHYNYVGDSIFGHNSHLGAGAIASNLKTDKTNIVIKYNGTEIETGLRKMGAILGDGVQVGCNSVLNPGTIVMKNTDIYPLALVRGVIEKNCIYKSKEEIIKKY